MSVDIISPDRERLHAYNEFAIYQREKRWRMYGNFARFCQLPGNFGCTYTSLFQLAAFRLSYI
eukprot:scaffold12957_cov18-Prasinocladus_malaysianus.AAC.1